MPPKKAILEESILNFIRGTGSTNGIKNEANFEDILNSIKYETLDTNNDGKIDASTTGYYYERLWDLCIKFNLTNLTIDDKIVTSHIFGNPNEGSEQLKIDWDKIGGLRGFLNEKVRSGSSGGYSDITFINKNQDNTETLYFISVKYFKNEKSIDKYDIGKLCALMKEHEKPDREIKIFIFLKNKIASIAKFKAQMSSSNILIRYINPHGKYENVYDTQDLHKYYFKLRQLLSQYNYFEKDIDIDNFEKEYLGKIMPPFIPRFHQKLFIDKISDLIIIHNEQGILVGAIPRSGKSYIMAGSILDYVKKKFDGKKYFNFIIITPAPNETFGEYMDIFQKFIDFQINKIDVTTFDKKINVSDLKKDMHNIIIVSKQKLGWAEPGKEGVEKIEKIDERLTTTFGNIIGNIEIMYLDEAHFGMSTQTSMEILNILEKFGKVPKVYVTATYNKPLKIYNISENCKLTWDINNINIMTNLTDKSINNNLIKDQFGSDIYENALEYFGDRSGKDIIDNLIQTYSIFPKPYMITSIWDIDKINIEKKKIGNTNYGFDMAKLFMTQNQSFKNGPQVVEMLRYYFGQPEKNMNYEDASFYTQNGIIPRIKKICSGKSRTMQEGNKLTSQLWFLPVGSEVKGESSIEDKTAALLELIMNNNEFSSLEYHYYVAVNIKNKKGLDMSNKYITYMTNPKNIKKEIEKVEHNLISDNNEYKGRNLIILAGNRLQLGISLRSVDIVTMWNSITSSDAIFQMLFRCMTEVDEPECEKNGGYCNQKRFGFMVDLNPQRAMTNVNLFSENITYKQNASDTDKYRQISDIINIDSDKMIDQYGENPTQSDMDKFTQELFNKFYENWNSDVSNIKKITENFNYDMTFLDKVSDELRNIKLSKNARTIKVKIKTPNVKVEPGAKKEKVSDADRNKLIKEEMEVKDIPIEEIAAELIAELISLLNIFTLYLDSDVKCILLNDNKSIKNVNIISDIKELINIVFDDINSKNTFLKILNGRLGGDDNDEFPPKIIDIIVESINNSTDKNKMGKLIHDQKKHYYTIKEPDKLLEYLNDNLAPKKKEKEEHGEVFTPIKLVIEQLDLLPIEVWSNPNLKWLDPAVGIGNYPVIIYLRLLKGLEKWEPNEENRRKHILEKMIYMVEISDKSIFILNKVFCDINSGGQYKLNIFKGSFIKDDDFEYYTTDIQFNIILGNPPYNKGGIKSKNTDKVQKDQKGYETIWPKFVERSYELLIDNGYLLYIHPASWIGLKSYNGELLTRYQIMYLKFYNYGQALNLFGNESGKIPLTYYLTQKINTKNDTLIYDHCQETYIPFNIYENRFIPTESINMMKKIFEFTKKYGALQNKYSSCRNKKEVSDTKSSEYKYPIINITYGNIGIKYSKINNNKTNEKKLVLSNCSMGYPIYDNTGLLYASSSDNYLIYSNNNEYELKQIQNYLYTNILFYLINITKTRQNFFDNKIFSIIPDITKITKEKDITDDFLIKLFKLTTNDIKCLEKYKISGEGRLTNVKINAFKNFDINVHKNIPKSETKKTLKKSIEKTVSIPSNLFKTQSSKSIKTFKKRPDPKNNGKQQIYNEKTERWNTDTEANRKKILTQKK